MPTLDEIRRFKGEDRLRTFRVRCEALGIDNIRRTFYENVVTKTEVEALLMMAHYATTYPAPLSFVSEIVEVFENGSSGIPPLDIGHPMFWGPPELWDENTCLLHRNAR